MKKLFGVLLFISLLHSDVMQAQTFKPKVIDGKPTFDQTIGYIQANHASGYHLYTLSTDFAVEVKILNFSVKHISGTDSLQLDWEELITTRIRPSRDNEISSFKLRVVFSIKDIEGVSVSALEHIAGLINSKQVQEGSFLYGINFKAASGKPLIKINTVSAKGNKVENIANVFVPAGMYNVKSNRSTVITEFENSSLFKAFNHLRALVGAAEPLKFD